MTPSRRRPTAADVARRSGVSSATVSYVLNSTPGQTIPAKTRERVLAAAAELGYVQHSAAQTLARGSSRVVLIDMSGLPHGALADASARLLVERFEQAGWTPVLAWWTPDQSARMLARLARAVVPVAVVTVTPVDSRLRRELSGIGIRTITSLAPDPSGVDPSIARAAQLQLEHLAARGRRSVVYAAPLDPALAGLAAVRRQAAHEAAAEHGLAFAALPDTADLDGLAASLAAAADTGADAVACYNDEVAMRVLAALRRTGLLVPDDIAVIGVDDLPLAELTAPSLTTVRMSGFDAAEIAERIGRLIAAEDPDPGSAHPAAGSAATAPPAEVPENPLEFSLVIRESA